MKFKLWCLLFAATCSNGAMINLAVSDFDAQDISSQEVAIITDRLRVELIGTGAYRVMERSMMNEILKEQGFQQSGACNTSKCQVQLGRLLGVERLVIGTVGKLGDLYSISIRMISVESGEILCAFSEDHNGAIEGLVKTPIKSLASQLAIFADSNSRVNTKQNESSNNQYWGHNASRTINVQITDPNKKALEKHTNAKIGLGFFYTGLSQLNTRWSITDCSGDTYFDGPGYYITLTYDFGLIQPGGHFYPRISILYSLLVSAMYNVNDPYYLIGSNHYDFTNWILPNIGGVYRNINPKYEYWGYAAIAPVSFSLWDQSPSLNIIAEIGIEYGVSMGAGLKSWFYSGIIPTYLPIDVKGYDLEESHVEYFRVNNALIDLYFFKRF